MAWPRSFALSRSELPSLGGSDSTTGHSAGGLIGSKRRGANMPSRSTQASLAKQRQRIDHFFDIVAKLLAKRWLLEQQIENQPESKQGDDSRPGETESNS